MNLQRIREKTAYLEQPKNDLPMAGRIFAQTVFKGTVGITLTLKQSFKVVSDRGTYYKRLDRDDCAWMAKRFKQKLNQAIFGNNAKRFNKSIRFLASVEGGTAGTKLHLHIVIGELPAHIQFKEIEGLIVKAKNKIAEINEEYEVNIVDSGWAEYSVKTITKKNTNSILWDLI